MRLPPWQAHRCRELEVDEYDSIVTPVSVRSGSPRAEHRPVQPLAARYHRLGFDLDTPSRVEQARHNDHSGGRSGRSEHVSVHVPDCLGIGSVHQVHPRPDDIGEPCSEFFERLADYLEATTSLDRRVGVNGPVGPNRCSARHDDSTPHPERTAEADPPLERRTALHP